MSIYLVSTIPLLQSIPIKGLKHNKIQNKVSNLDFKTLLHIVYYDCITCIKQCLRMNLLNNFKNNLFILKTFRKFVKEIKTIAK